MIHRMLRYPPGWEWHVLQQVRYEPAQEEPLPSRKNILHKSTKQSEQSDEDSIPYVEQLKRLFPECASWIDECEGRRTNQISVRDTSNTDQLLYGTLMFQVTEDESDVQPFHFWLTKQRLITMHEDMRLPLRLQSREQSMKFESCGTAPEALFIMLSVILETFHEGLDGFETRLSDLESAMRIENRTGLLEVILERRYDLLHWNHLFIPVRELQGAAKEAFMEDLTETEAFKRISHKLDRIDVLLNHYAMEIDTLISMDDAISSFRGNDIMKTLTIFTVLFLPATILGSLWGSNFNKLPWKDHAWGFPAMITVIAIITIIIYIWLWRKGWTGDILNGHKSKESTSDDTEKQTRSSRISRKKSSPKQNAPVQSSRDKAPLSRSRKNRN